MRKRDEEAPGTFRVHLWKLLGLLYLAPIAQAAEPVTFKEHILPVFKNACLNCHNPDKKKAGLDLSTYQGALQGGENGPVLNSGDPGASLLFKCVKQTEEPRMPPKGDKLSDAELALLEKWIAGQLIESVGGKVVAAAKNNVQVAVVSLIKPEGPPPMPGELPLEPAVHTRQPNALTALAASPWAPLVAIGGQKQIILYHTETLEPLGVLPFPEGFPAIIRFSRNGQLLLTGGGLGGKSGKVALWNIATGERVATLGDEFDQVLAADVSADQQFIALGGPNRIVKLHSTADGRLITSIKKHTDWVTALAFSPDGNFLATADRAGGIHVWEGATGREFTSLPGHKAMVTALAFMPGLLASASEDGRIVLWDVKEGKESRAWNAHAGGATWVDFTADGLLVSCGRDKLAKVWDATGKQLGASAPFAEIALRAALSSERVIAGDWSGRIRVCALDGKPLGELTSNPPPLADRLSASLSRVSEVKSDMTRAQAAFVAAEEKRQRAIATALQAAAEFVGPRMDSSVPQASEEEAAKAKGEVDRLAAQLAAAESAVHRWELARHFQTVHEARRTLREKQAKRESLTLLARSSMEPAEKARSEVALAGKSADDLRAAAAEMDRLLVEATTAVEPAKRAVTAMELALTELNTSARALADATPPELLGKPPAGAPSGNEPTAAALASITEGLEKARAAVQFIEQRATLAAREAADAKAAAEQARQRVAEVAAKATGIERTALAARIEAENALALAAQEASAAEAQTRQIEDEYAAAKLHLAGSR